MSSIGLDPATPTGAVDPIAILTKPSAETQEPITSSSAVLISGEVYSFCLVYPSFLLHTDVVLIVRAVTSRVCYRSILNPSNQLLPWHALSRAPKLFCANSSASRPCFPLRLRRWLKTPRR